MKHSPKTYFNWSTGKDSSLAMYYLQREGITVDLLLTSVNNHFNRVSMHGIRRELLHKQAKSLGIPLETIELPETPSMEEYNEILQKKVNDLQAKNYTKAVFGDIFLEDLKVYRENQLKPYGIECYFPLWKKDTRKLVEEFIELGFKAVVVSTKAELLDESFVGREISESFLKDLPKNVDPCGENGEFHTFCYDGPIFKSPILFQIGEKQYKQYELEKGKEDTALGFWFCDLIPL